MRIGRENLSGREPGELWQFYTHLTQVEEAFKNLEKDQKMLLFQLGWELPAQPPPQLTAKGELLKD